MSDNLSCLGHVCAATTRRGVGAGDLARRERRQVGMKAVAFAEFGGPEAIDVIYKPDPVPGVGEVVVAVAAATVNPTDLLNLSGTRAHLMAHLSSPFTTGMDFAGRVAAVGEGVTSLAVGDPVIGVVNPRRPAGGAQAERIAVSAKSVAMVAERIDLVAAATVPMNALTGMLSLELLRLAPGQSLLITGAAGMLGGLSAQLALAEGLDVFVTAADRDREFLEGLGVRHILPRDEGLESALRTACPEGVDGVIDGALIGQKISHLVRTGGAMVSPRTTYRIEDPRLSVHYVQVTDGVEDSEKITRIARLLDEGKLTPRLAPGGIFPAARAQEAFRMAATGGFRGRTVIAFGPQRGMTAEPTATDRDSPASTIGI
jgi:NADPH2:quinone reductase